MVFHNRLSNIIYIKMKYNLQLSFEKDLDLIIRC